MIACQAAYEAPPKDCVAPVIGASIDETTSHGGQACEGLVARDYRKEIIALLPRLRRFALSLTRSAVEADELVQETCLQALRKINSYDPAQPLDRWLFRVMRNLWISELRKRKVRQGEGQVPADESDELVAPETGEAGVAAGDLRGHIAALPAELSSVLLMVSVEGYSYAEAAEMLDVPVGTVMSRMHRARKTLAARIAQPVEVRQ